MSGILPFCWPLWLYQTGGSLLLYDKEVEASLMVTFLYFVEAVGSLASDMCPACVVRCLLAWLLHVGLAPGHRVQSSTDLRLLGTGLLKTFLI